ncbi:PREDICTED: probable methyltransferase PMT16 isoform X2 [Nelumbo nucifera]|uniref:Methyltransferase n=1 Tax=Nelumbo nucifera TaxID=4432 RepID=A0A1U8Q2V0_NELNU|nr:PREDICTED: probable methyltransferase PMT16 isoform X2 [Nelumbo nucifera]
MASLNPPSYSASYRPYNPYLKKPSLFKMVCVTFLCSAAYLFGVWKHSGGSDVMTASPTDFLGTIRCAQMKNATQLPTATVVLDFSTHQAAEDTITLPPPRGPRYFPACDVKYSEYTPCEDTKRSLKFERDRLIYRERHCPQKAELLKCRVPAPYGYKSPFTWPESRDFAWYANVPHKELTVEKAGQNWIRFEGDRFRFPGGGTMFPNGADAYIDEIGKLINLRDGSIRTAIDTDGLYLIEVDRILRPGGYWILSGPPINWKRHWKGWQRTQEDLSAEQSAIEAVAKSLCWKKLVEKGDIAIWQKPTNHIYCKKTRKVFKQPQFCQAQDPDRAWYSKMETCLTPLPEVSDIKEIAGGQLEKWPNRLQSVPPRISSGSLDGVTAETFREDTELWKKRVAHYKAVSNQLAQKGRYRNLLDMNAHLGGFAAALIDDPVWVINVVPTEAKINTLGAIYERGLIGTYQDWCEAMSTYPRTYDLIHADSVLTLYKDRCEIEDILLEMDRILRPEGTVIFRDDVDILVTTKSITDGMNWDSHIVDHEKGPHQREKLLFAVKRYWTASAPASDQQDPKTVS